MNLIRFATASQACAAWLAAAHAAFPAVPPGVPGVEFRDAITWLAYTGLVPIMAARQPVADGARRKRARTTAVPSVAPQQVAAAYDDNGRRVLFYIPIATGGDVVPARVVVWMTPVCTDMAVRFTTPIGAAFLAQQESDELYSPALRTFLAHGNAFGLLLPDDARSAGTAPSLPRNMFTPRPQGDERGAIDLYRRPDMIDGTAVPTAHVPAGTATVALHGGVTARLLVEALAAPQRAVPPFTDGDAEGIAAALSDLFTEMLGRRVRVAPVLRAGGRPPAPPAAPTPRTRRRDADESESESDDDRED